MGIFSNAASSLIARWDLDGVQMSALRKVQGRTGLEVAASMPAEGQSRPRARKAASFFFRFVLNALAGLAGAAGVLFPSFFIGSAFSYTLIMLIAGLTLLNYFTTVLLDTSENRILFHLPISGRTLLAARLLCIAKYAGLLVFAVSLPTAVGLAFRFGAVALLFFAISLALTLILIVAVSLAVCLFALRFVKPTLIRQGIFFLQLALIMFGIYGASDVINARAPLMERLPDVSGATWWYFYPPGWMAGLLDFFLVENTRFNGILAATAVLVPLAGLVGCIRMFAGARFTVLLSRLESVPRGSTSRREGSASWFAGLLAQFSVLMNRHGQERAVFDLTSKLAKRNLAMNLLAYTCIAPMVLNLGTYVREHYDHRIHDLPITVSLAFYAGFYIPLMLAYMAPKWMQDSPEWRGTWCYQVLPFSGPGVIVSGTMKAYVRRYLVPIYLVSFGLVAAVWGLAQALDVLFAAAATTLLCIHRFSSAAGVLPQSREPVSGPAQADGQPGKLVFILMSAGLIGAHVLLGTFAGTWGVAGGIVTMVGAILVAGRKLRGVSSKDVEAPDRHVGWHSTSV